MRSARSFMPLVGSALLLIVGTACVHNGSRLYRSGGTRAPARAGVFFTADDYEAGRFADYVECENATRQIASDAFARGSAVQLPERSSTGGVRYEKSAVYGCRACDGTDIRFVGGENYRLERAAPLFLYERQRRVSRGKGGSRLVYDYFFSTSAADSVRPLTRLALKQAYPTNHRFHDLLDLAFHSDDELTRFDDFHHEYQVARLLRQTLTPVADIAR